MLENARDWLLNKLMYSSAAKECWKMHEFDDWMKLFMVTYAYHYHQCECYNECKKIVVGWNLLWLLIHALRSTIACATRFQKCLSLTSNWTSYSYLLLIRTMIVSAMCRCKMSCLVLEWSLRCSQNDEYLKCIKSKRYCLLSFPLLYNQAE